MKIDIEKGLTSFGSGLERLTCGTLDGLGRVFEHGTHALSLVAVPVADGVVSIVAARAVAQMLGFPMWLSIAAGVAMEGVGVLVADVPMAQRRFNQTRSDGEPAVMADLGWVVLGVQSVFSITLIVLNAAGMGATLFGMTPAVFGMLTLGVQSFTATIAAVLHEDLKQRNAARTRRQDSDRRERERAKAERRAARQTAKPAPVPNIPERTPRQERIVQYVSEHRNDSLNEIAQALELSKTMVHTELAAVGMRKNGHGWEGR